MPTRARLSGLVLCTLAALCADAGTGAAQKAQPSLSGTWRAGATSMDVAIQSWGKDCGPRPQSARSAGGGSVRISQEGQVVTIHGVDRDLRSDRCWSPNPALRKVSSSASGGQWTTRCKTADDDPRKETGTYTLRALSADTLQYQDVSHFDWKLNESTCVATITTTQTLSRVTGEARPQTPGAGTQPTQPATAPKTPCTPGAPARLVLRPRSADVELGQKVCFQARLLDAKGCAIEGIAPSWSLEHGKAIKGRLDGGCFRAGERSAESEGTFKVIASAAGLRATASVQVSAVSLPALIAKRLETGAVQGEPEPEAEAPPAPAPAQVEATSRVAAKALVDSGPRGRRWLIGLAALLAAFAAVAVLLRARPAARRRAPSGSGGKRGSEPGRASAEPQRPSDELSRTSSASERTSSASQRTGSELERTSSASRRAQIRRCPRCGASYPENSAFCGVDGSALAPPE